MEPEGSLPSSQKLSTCTYPEPNVSSRPKCTESNIVMTGRVAGLIKRGSALVTGFIRFDYKPQKITIT
jgi:hypothetical protein